MKIRPKRLIIKLAFGIVTELILQYAEKRGKYWADELRELLETIREHESL